MHAEKSDESAFFLLDTLANWPWKRAINKHYLQVKLESSAWIRGFNAFSPIAQHVFDLCDINLLASLAYPLQQKDVARAGCDLMNLFFLFDEYTDLADPHEAHALASMVMSAIKYPNKPRPANEGIVGEAARQFWELSMKCATPSARLRFVEMFDKYAASVVEQAKDRALNHIRTIEDYFPVRHDTIGTKPSFVLLHFSLDLPDRVFDNPAIVRLTNACIDMLILGNDLCSYNIEQARGDDDHNIVKIVMHQQQTDIWGARQWIDKYHSKLAENFLADMKCIPLFGDDTDIHVKRYVDGLGNWVRANDCWSFESHRYFRRNGMDIKRIRRVVPLPRVRSPSTIFIAMRQLATFGMLVVLVLVFLMYVRLLYIK